MILESFMVYEVEFYEEDVISKDSKPSLVYYSEEAGGPQEAIVEAIKEIGGEIKKYNIGIINNVKFLENGRLLVNPKTGEFDSLEGKLKQEQ